MTSLEEFINDLYESSFYDLQTDEFKAAFKHYEPWQFYTYNNNPSRVYSVNESVIKIVMLDFEGNVESGIIKINDPLLEKIDEWKADHILIIQKFAMPSIFLMRLGYVGLLDLY